jgi:hypothetical protein
MFVISGVLIVATAVVAPRLAFPLIIGVCVFSAVGVFVYSYVAWRQEGSQPYHAEVAAQDASRGDQL